MTAKAKTPNARVVTQVFGILKTMAKPIVEGMALAEKAKATLDGAYDIAMNAARLAQDKGDGWATFEAAWSRLEHAIKTNDGKMAEAFNAPVRTKASKDGFTHTLPWSITTARSRIKAAFSSNVELYDTDAKTGEKTPKSYRAVVRELQAQNDVRREAEATEAAKNLKGDDKLRYEIAEGCARITTACKTLEGSELALLHRDLSAVVAMITLDETPEAAPAAATG